jgi:hypothetical protein
MKKQIFARLLGTLILALVVLVLSAQESIPNSLFNELSSLEKPKIQIELNMQKILDERDTGEEFPATFTVYSGKEEVSSWDIKVTHRGRFRRKVCNFPPLKLDFDKDQLKERGLAKFDKFKLVTHCIEDKFGGNENLKREHMVYQLYNQVTDLSYRTLLLEITYVDSEDPKNSLERYGILIEPNKEIENRLNAEEMDDLMNPDRDLLDLEVENQVALFQYLVGNEDWSVEMMRNIKGFRSNETGKIWLVPYDFDFSGIVRTSYAIPNTDEGLVSIEERAFMGLPTTPEIFAQTKAKYIELEKNLDTTIKKTKQLSGEGKLYMRTYLDGFYRSLNELKVPFHQADTKGEPERF